MVNIIYKHFIIHAYVKMNILLKKLKTKHKPTKNNAITNARENIYYCICE